MKQTILFFSFLLFIPLAFALDFNYNLSGGETWSYHFNECDILRVNITGNLTIDEGEYTILNNCTKNQTNYYVCDCTNDYDFKVSFKINTINNYTFDFNYAYSKVIEEQQSSGGGGSSSRSRRTRICTPNWNCTEWANCQSNSRATRTCNDLNECNATKPSEERYCYYYVPKTISVGAKEETGIEQVEVTEPIEQPESQEEKGMALGWKILIGIFIVIIILAIVLLIKNRESDIYDI